MNAGNADRSPWENAVTAASLVAIDHLALGAIAVRGPAGPVRDTWMQILQALLPPAVPIRKLPLNAAGERLFGGLDLSATLAQGLPVTNKGLLAETNGGVVVIPSCERLQPSIAARLGLVLDGGVAEPEGRGTVHSAQLAIVAMDESLGEDEGLPASIAERIAVFVDLAGIHPRETEVILPDPDRVERARRNLATVTVPDAITAGLCAAAISLGIPSLRPPLCAVRVARMSAALAGRSEADAADAAVAASFALAPKATMVPEPPPRPPREQPNEAKQNDGEDAEQEQDRESESDGELTDMILAAVHASLPRDLLTRQHGKAIRVPANAPSGKCGAERRNAMRGRPAGVRPGRPGAGAPLSVIETLRAAAPWQRLRTAFPGTERGTPGGGTVAAISSALSIHGQPTEAPSGRSTSQGSEGQGRRFRVQIRRDDFRVKRLIARSRTATIFAVDASGSTAFQRLAEAKGAVELLLAECYIRRDQVSLVVFRGKSAEVALPPTRSLARAKRALSALPGGGGTPLACGIQMANTLAVALRRKGVVPVVILLTDGRANVGSNGEGGRERARKDAVAAARRLKADGIAAMLVDTSPRPQAAAEGLAQEMAARYIPLPFASASALSNVVKMVGA